MSKNISGGLETTTWVRDQVFLIEPTREDRRALREILQPYDPSMIRAYQVFTLADLVRNKGPDVKY